MKTFTTTLFFLLIPIFLIAQKVTIKDVDEHVLLEINDEGTTGSIILPGLFAPTVTTNKLYNAFGNLYWNGKKLGTTTEAGGWTLNDLNLYPTNLSTKVGVGTMTPTYNLQIEGSDQSGVSLSINNTNTSGFERLLFGTDPGNDGSIVLFEPNHLFNANKFIFTNKRATGIFSWTIDESEHMSLNSNGQLSLTGKLKIGDDSTLPSAGAMRYNVGSKRFEGHNGGSWNELAWTKWKATGNDIYYNDGNVGIGTDAPSVKLTIIDSVSWPGNVMNCINLSDGGIALYTSGGTGVISEGISYGVRGYSMAGAGISGSSMYGNGISGSSDHGTGIYGYTDDGFAGFFDGEVFIHDKISTDPDSAKAILHIRSEVKDPLRVEDDENDISPFIVKNTGRVGIGTSAPNAKLYVLQTLDEDVFRVDDSFADFSPFIIKSNGNVGIGDDEANEKLDVKGNIRSLDGIIYSQEVDQKISLLTNASSNYVQLDVGGTGHESDAIILGDVNNADNNIGIGTNDPVSPLDLVNDEMRVRLGYVPSFSTIEYAVSALYGSGTRGELGRREITFPDNWKYFYGVYGSATDNTSRNNYGVYGKASGASTFNWAGYFEGNVKVEDDLDIDGNLSKGSGTFKIDHPLDPENKYLYHSFVESPDMMNIYNGNVILNGNGKAIVRMPEWFNALNKEFRYQLTAIGAPCPNLYVESEISDNQFSIAGGTPGIKVSWQVTGVRQDAYANMNRVKVEEDKTVTNRGTYLHPEAFGKPETMKEGYERHRINQ